MSVALQSYDEDYVLPAWLAQQAAGHDVCLVTLVGIEGSCPRPLGSQITVSTSGLTVGHITDGCAEEAIKTEALAAIKSGIGRLVRYGKGSPYKDITLPCGSGLDIHFAPMVSQAVLQSIDESRAARTPAALLVDPQTHKISATPYDGRLATQVENGLYRPYLPALRLKIFGKGRIVNALVTLAAQSGFGITVMSPDTDTLEKAKRDGVTARYIARPQDALPLSPDPWTAIALLFHDHDWEYPILENLLGSQAFYIGALGSRKTQAARSQALIELGLSQAKIAQLQAPIGLDIQATTPSEIVISILAEIIQTYRTPTRGPARW